MERGSAAHEGVKPVTFGFSLYKWNALRPLPKISPREERKSLRPISLPNGNYQKEL
jgi:hypothetical protein